MDVRSLLSGAAVLVYREPGGKIGWVRTLRNQVTYEGVNWLLETAFRGGPQATAIRCGLINDAGYTGESSADTHASHPGWNEWGALASATRPVWTPQAPGAGNMGTTIAPHFDFTGAGILRGAFLSTIAAVGSVAPGVLYNTIISVAGLPVSSGGSLDLSPSVSLEI